MPQIKTISNSFFTHLYPGLLILSAAIFVLYASYPGYMNPDSVNQLTQIYTGNYTDWHSPFITLTWSLTHKFLPGPFGFILLVNILIWGSLAIILYKLHITFKSWALIILIFPFLPGVLNFLGNVHKDALLVGWLIAAVTSAYLSHIYSTSKPKRLLFQALSNIFLLATFLTRPNAIFAIVPVLLYANAHLKIRYNVLISLFLVTLMFILPGTLTKLTSAHATHPSSSIKTYHLLGLSYLEGQNLFPGKWTDEQSKKIVEACYTPVQWDTAAIWGKCGFIHKELINRGLWGSDILTKKWLTEVLSRPQSTLTIMYLNFYRSIFDPNSRSMFYKPEKSDLFHWEVKTDPPRLATKLVQQYVYSPVNDTLGRPWFFALISITGLLALIKFKLLDTHYGLFSFTLLSSSLIYLLSYLLTTVSAEFRYFYWSGISSYLGAVMLFFAWQTKGIIRINTNVLAGLRTVSLILIAITSAIFLSYEQLPNINRTISITPLDKKPVVLNYLRRASIPGWMSIKLDGNVNQHQWLTSSEGAFYGNNQNGTLTTTIATFGQAIEVSYKTGPEYGRARVKIDDQEMIINLSQPLAKEELAYLWPSPDMLIFKHYSAWKWPLKLLIYLSIIFLCLLWFTRPRPVWLFRQPTVLTEQCLFTDPRPRTYRLRSACS